MVRIRKQDGSTTKVDKFEAVEILDTDGRLAMVTVTDRRDVIKHLFPGDPLFTGYCRAHGMYPATVHRHDPFPVQPVS